MFLASAAVSEETAVVTCSEFYWVILWVITSSDVKLCTQKVLCLDAIYDARD